MSVTTGSTATAQTGHVGPNTQDFSDVEFDAESDADMSVYEGERVHLRLGEHDPRLKAKKKAHELHQMGAKRIGSLAIGIGVVGIVLNEMVDLDIVANSSGVINVTSIFSTAGAGLNLLVVGVIIAAAAVLLSLWSGF